MTDTDLERRLEGLFSDGGPEAETEGAGAAGAEAGLEKAIADLLAGAPEAEAEAAGAPGTATAGPSTAVAATLLGVETTPDVAMRPMPVKPAAVGPLYPAAYTREGKEALKPPPPMPPAAGVRRWVHRITRDVRPGEPRLSTRSIMLHNATTIGGVLLFLLLTGLILRDPLAWSGNRTLYLAGYGAGVLVTLIQWLFSFSLSRTIREAGKKNAAAAHLQTLLKERADELATANALLQKSTLQLRTAVQISQATAAVLDPHELMQQAVSLMRERFDLHYVGLFVVDQSGQWATLRAGSGEAGQRMLAQGTRIEVGSASALGWSMASAQARVASGLDIISRQSLVEASPLLAETRSKVALPLSSRGRVIGALDVHSTDLEAFSEEDIAVLQAVADQIAVALDNAETFAQIQAKLDELEASQKRAVRERWLDALATQAGSSYERTRPGLTPLDDATTSGASNILSQAVEQAQERGEVVARSGAGGETRGQGDGETRGQGEGQAASGAEAVLVAPISLRGEIMGALGLHEPEGKHWWTDDEIALVEAVADQMALAIENARLLADTRQRAERERLIADVSAQVRASTDVNTILRTAIRELGRSLRASDGLIRLGVGGGGYTEGGGEEPSEDKGVEGYDGAGA
jgi:GAF domain-containing protein